MACLGLSAAILAVWFLVIRLGGAEEVFYIAAVYEHKVILNPTPEKPVERRAALEHMKKNLDVYEEQAAISAKQGVQIIVFPEDGIHGFNYTRASIASYLETVPDPEVVTWSPCADPERFSNTEVLHRLSCIARKNRLFLVANMADRQACSRATDPHCPPDGQYQFNTDVVFSDNGTLVARYHKQNLFFEASYDTPPKPEHTTFTTPFAGRFGVFTCFDILFKEPVVTLVEDMGIRQLVFLTAWMNKLPLLDAVQFQRSFSYSTGVTLLAANLRKAEKGMTGSGIYTPRETVYHHAMEGEQGKLLVSKVPVLDPLVAGGVLGRANLSSVPFSGHPKTDRKEEDKTRFLNDDQVDATQRKPEAKHCLKESGCNKEESTPFIAPMMHDNFTFVLLEGRQGNITVCDGSFCCHLLFRRSKPHEEELYALGAFGGLHVIHGTYYLEVCALVRCTGQHKESCGGGIDHAETLVDFQLDGTFSTKHIYAGVLGSGMTLYLPDRSGWESRGRFYMTRKGMTTGLVTAVLYGRVYEKDST
ncbi:biotinidase-like [Brachyhypopomus gauderio]|uniref:biotinidase-like n=1 Tax=Brachyhypopomus gauderio TaxID=698409 RepID=UPI004041C103